MFNDERINAECGRIYGKGILLAVLITLFYVTSRTVTLILQRSLRTVVTFTEAVILLFGHRNSFGRRSSLSEKRG